MPAPVTPPRVLDVLLPTLGSAGDVHPMIAIGLALRARGHRATVITSPYHQALIERQGLGFLPVGTLAEAEAAIHDPDLWHPRRGFRVVAERVIAPATPVIYRLIEARAGPGTVIVGSSIAFGARLAAEKLGLPLATLHLQPAVIRSLADHGMFGDLRLSARQPRWWKRSLIGFADWLVIDRQLGPPLNEFRATLGLAPVRHILGDWLHSPRAVIGAFPEWYAERQPDWPAQLTLTGFPLWDGGDATALPAAAESFLAAGPASVVFTAGSAAATQHAFFRESLAAVRRLGVRAMLVTNHAAQLPASLPAGVAAFGYLPFSRLLPRAAALVHHGGIGTVAQAIHAGIPQLVVPSGHDQFDNGWRVTRLALGASLPEARYRGAPAAALLARLLGDPSLGARVLERSRLIDSNAALAAACRVIEALAPRV